MPDEMKKTPIFWVVNSLLRLFFRLLYHSFAWTYDFVAAAVSMGRWKHWVLSISTMLQGPRVLELGFGPGHLQTYLHQSGVAEYGLDESMQMARQAQQRLLRLHYPPHLTRGVAQALPYAGATFNSVAATFPTEYILEPGTLAEIQRVLVPGGRLVVLMASWITGNSLRERALRTLYQITSQVPPENQDIADFIIPYQQAGFQTSIRFIEPKGARLMFIIAKKG